MTKILFWNLNKGKTVEKPKNKKERGELDNEVPQDIDSVIPKASEDLNTIFNYFAETLEVDVLIVAEYPLKGLMTDIITHYFNEINTSFQNLREGLTLTIGKGNTKNQKIIVFQRKFMPDLTSNDLTQNIPSISYDLTIEPVSDENLRLSFISTTKQANKILIVVVHLEDPISYPQLQDRLIGAMDVRKIIDKYRSDLIMEAIPFIIVGDFNMNPYDWGLNTEQALHTIPPKPYYNKNLHSFPLINLSWGWFGKDVQYFGTYKWKKRTLPIWHIIDQILVTESIAIQNPKCYPIYRVNKIDLFKISDHLPIFASLPTIH